MEVGPRGLRFFDDLPRGIMCCPSCLGPRAPSRASLPCGLRAQALSPFIEQRCSSRICRIAWRKPASAPRINESRIDRHVAISNRRQLKISTSSQRTYTQSFLHKKRKTHYLPGRNTYRSPIVPSIIINPWHDTSKVALDDQSAEHLQQALNRLWWGVLGQQEVPLGADPAKRL